ncbi:hypothetical protein BG011_002493 [Mortierella polycephala]|uniref:F-box domain-containing protein n=1 Tax=Mortierella polycephala TaxID=41804 RepID=A0A9P6U562_9FUNG|nr:hypothetical protein BG011_002493 [Mortierella polycephala]
MAATSPEPIHALQIPEILELIARYVPLFYSLDDDDRDTMDPSHLYSCILVSHQWHQCFLPHLYHYYDDRVMGSMAMPIFILRKHAHLIRRYICLAEVQTLLDLQPKSLLGLHTNTTLAGWRPAMDHLLLKCGHQLRELTLSGTGFSEELKDDRLQALMHLPYLEELRLMRWRISTEALRGILNGCSANLSILSLGTISGFNEHAFGPWTGTSYSKEQEQEPQHWPWLSKLRVLQMTLDFIQSPASIHLPRICPALETVRLIVDQDDDFDLTVLSRTLREHCPKLDSIMYTESYSMRNEYGFFPQSTIYAALFKDSTRKLRSATLSLPEGMDDEMLEALLSQAATLEAIELRCARSCSMGMSDIIKILASCARLKSVVLLEANCPSRDLDQLLTQPWACQNLQTLKIDGLGDGKGLEDGTVRVRLLEHMRKSGLGHVRDVSRTMDAH